jgi:predicted Zn-dependent protease
MVVASQDSIRDALAKSKSGYADLRFESVVTENIEIRGNGTANSHKVCREGTMARVADEGGFRATSGSFELTPRDSPFSGYLREQNFVNPPDNMKETKPRETQDPEKMRSAAISLASEHVSFSFTSQIRTIDWANTLGQRARRKDITDLVRIVAQHRSQSGPFVLRSFLRNPSLESLNKNLTDLKEMISVLKDADLVNPGATDVVLHPSVSAVLAHELIGHYSEISSRSVFDEPKFGVRIAEESVNVSDHPSESNSPGPLTFDDEGIPSTKVPIIEQGVLTGALHSLETAFRNGARPNGRGQARDFRYVPRSRMMNICFEPGEKSFEELIAAVSSGYYLAGSLGGIYARGTFQINCQYGYEIRNGKIGKPVIGPTISGDIFETISRIVGIGNDLTWIQDGGCFAEEQFLLNSGRGSPHLLLRGILVH